MFFDWFRKKYGAPRNAWTLDDPTELIKEAPYTFFVPSRQMIKLLVPGDLVKLIFRSSVPREKWNAEKMWVEITDIAGDAFTGKLANDPYDMPQIKAGDEIKFNGQYIVDLIVVKPERLTSEQVLKIAPERREFWDRCLVDDCVLYDKILVGYLYREEPENLYNEDKFKDSGWRIRGDGRGSTELQCANRKTSFVALGAVLNRDDSWLHLIDEEVGIAYSRDFVNNEFIKIINRDDLGKFETS